MLNTGSADIILASTSASRAALLAAARVKARREPPEVDEKAVREVLEKTGGVTASDTAEVLARAKAEAVSERFPGAHVIGADQILALENRIFEKPEDMEAARATLLALRGKTHALHACVAVARGGDTRWSHTDVARLTMRDFTPEFAGRYLAEAGADVLKSVGAYQLEGAGVHLFEEIDGDFFTILGLPLLPLLGFLRREGAIAE